MSFRPMWWCLPLILPCLYGFVFINANKPRLAATLKNPTVTFHWDGLSPAIGEKAKYHNGIYKNLSDHDLFKVIIENAMGRWNVVPGSYVRLALAEDGKGDCDSTDGINDLCVTSVSDYAVSAEAMPWSKEENPKIIFDCDIRFQKIDATAQLLEHTVAHELGHCLGLGHSHTNVKSLMGYSRGGDSSALGEDDMAGVIYLYPDPNVSTVKEKEFISPESCSVVRNKPGAGRFPPPVAMALLLIPIAIARHRARKAVRCRLPVVVKKNKN